MINMQKGRIIKIISNQYTIQNEKEEIIAKPRGKMRQHEAPVVGDFVEYEKIEDSYRIHKVLSRTNRLLRPDSQCRSSFDCHEFKRSGLFLSLIKSFDLLSRLSRCQTGDLCDQT